MFESRKVRVGNHWIAWNMKANAIHMQNEGMCTGIVVPYDEYVARIEIRMMSSVTLK